MPLEEEVDPGHPHQRNVHHKRFLFGPPGDPWCREESMVGSGKRRAREMGGGVSSHEHSWVEILAHILTEIFA